MATQELIKGQDVFCTFRKSTIFEYYIVCFIYHHHIHNIPGDRFSIISFTRVESTRIQAEVGDEEGLGENTVDKRMGDVEEFV